MSIVISEIDGSLLNLIQMQLADAGAMMSDARVWLCLYSKVLDNSLRAD